MGTHAERDKTARLGHTSGLIWSCFGILGPPTPGGACGMSGTTMVKGCGIVSHAAVRGAAHRLQFCRLALQRSTNGLLGLFVVSEYLKPVVKRLCRLQQLAGQSYA